MEPRRAAGPLQVVRTVASAFFGVRRRSGHEEDSGGLNPLHVLAVGVVGVALLVLALILIVRAVVAH